MDVAYVILSMVALFVLAAAFDLFGGRAAQRRAEAAEQATLHLAAEMGDRLNAIEGKLDSISEVLDVEGYYERTAELRERGVDL